MELELDRARALAAGQEGLVSAAQLLELGFTRGRIAHLMSSGSSRAVLPGVYLLDVRLHERSWAELPLATRVRAAILFHGSACVICLSTAARLWGIQGLGRDDGCIQVLLPPGTERHQVPGIRIHTRLIDPCDIHSLGGVRLTSPPRTVLDLVLESAARMSVSLRLRQERAVQVLDSALHQRLIQPADLVSMQRAARGRRGAAIARPWWRQADGRAESPVETSVRLVAVAADLPPDDLQVPVRDRHGVLLGYGDLGWRLPRNRWLLAEVDGAGPHGLPTALYRDRFRANDFAATGMVDLIRFTFRDTLRPAYIVSQLRLHLARPA